MWVHSTAKADRHAASLQARLEAGVAAIETLAVKVACQVPVLMEACNCR